jgi:group I intron endonuclease
MTAGIYTITNLKNSRVYVGSSRNIERRFKSHIDDLKKGSHHSYKLQDDWSEYSENDFAKEIIHQFDPRDTDLELRLEIFERSEVIGKGAVKRGYNVSDEIIRNTSLVIKYCDETINTYLDANERRFIEFNEEYPGREIDIKGTAYEYLGEKLEELFIKSGLSKNEAVKLSFGYVIDAQKFRLGSFKYIDR